MISLNNNFYFSLAQFFFIAIMLNLVISVITDVFTSIQVNRVAADTRERIESLSDIYEMFL